MRVLPAGNGRTATPHPFTAGVAHRDRHLAVFGVSRPAAKGPFVPKKKSKKSETTDLTVTDGAET